MISGRTGDWLNRAPDKLANRQGQADRRDPQTGGGVKGTHKEADGLANAHGDEQNTPGQKKRDKDEGMTQCRKHPVIVPEIE